MAKVQVQNLCKIFDIKDRKVQALSSINLNIEDGSFVTIVGKSGCGKTTFLRVLCGLESNTSGRILFNNCEDRSFIKIGIVFQEARLMPWLTVKENMSFSLVDTSKEKIKDRVDKYLDILGLTNFKDAYPSEISGGMAQRVALGRTLCYDPDLILMDEPLGALDAFNRRKLQEELVNIFLKYKKTIIFVTHDVDEAIYLGQKVVVMDKGKIIREVAVDMPYKRDTKDKNFYYLREKILSYILI